MKLTAQVRRGDGREGTVAAVFAASLVAILSVVALTLDGAVLLDNRRQARPAGGESR